MRNQIKEIIVTEFTNLINVLANDIRNNFIQKNYNFLLSELDEAMTAHMVFVSSFESKSGNTIQECARQIASLRYGHENVPQVINLNNYDLTTIENRIVNTREQVIVTKTNIEARNVQEAIQGFLTGNAAHGQGRSRVESLTNQDSINQLLHLADEADETLHYKPVDLAFHDGEKWNIFEIKAGGNLDSSNAPSNAKKLLNLYVALNSPDAHAYFATFYHKDGEGNTWKGAMKKHLNYPEMFKIGKDFWDLVLPQGISFEEFKDIYSESMNEINLNQRLNDIIAGCVND